MLKGILGSFEQRRKAMPEHGKDTFRNYVRSRQEATGRRADRSMWLSQALQSDEYSRR